MAERQDEDARGMRAWKLRELLGLEEE